MKKCYFEELINNKLDLLEIIFNARIDVLSYIDEEINVKILVLCGSGLEIERIKFPCNLEQKQNIYGKIYATLKNGGVFINGDTIAANQKEENELMSKAEQIYTNENMPFASMHVDVPFCLEHEKEVLKTVGFSNINLIKEWTNTKIYMCKKI